MSDIFELVDPKTAEEWLMNNEGNRPVSPYHVKKLAEFMSRNQWQDNGDTIRFSKSGRLLDGQHRLKAVIMSGTTVSFRIVRGLDESTFQTIDTGKSRKTSDIAHILGIKNYVAASAAYRLLWSYEQDQDLTKSLSMFMSNLDFEPLWKKHPLLIESLRFRAKGTAGMKILRSHMLALHYIFSCVDKTAADYMFEVLIDGAGLQPGDVLGLLRDLLIKDAATAKRYRYRSSYICALTIKAWNLFYSNKKISRLVWLEDKGEKFPIVRGVDREMFLSGDQRPPFDIAA